MSAVVQAKPQEVQKSPETVLRGQLSAMSPQFAAALPSHITAEKFQRVVMTVVQQQPDLMVADRRTLLASCMKCAADGLIPDGREAALVIFNTKIKDGLAAIEKCAVMAEAYCVERYSPYGCNMAFRAEAIADLRFDERLVLYSWLEDRDFGGALAHRGGTLVKIGEAIGAHLGVKKGRMSGRKLGYSQVVNPIYLVAKGTMRPGYAARIVVRNLFANHLRAFRPEPWVDRFGRIQGNWMGLADCLRGRVTPERIEAL